MDTTVMTRLLEAATTGEAFDATGVEDNQETRDLYATLVDEINNVDGRVMVSPELEWPGDDYDDLIDSTYAAWGKPPTYEEMQKANKENATLVSKAISERMFTLGPLYIPNVRDAHNEWTDNEELQKAVWEYVKKGDRRIRLQHDKEKIAGEFVEIMTWPYEVKVPIVMKDATQKDLIFPADTVFLGVVWEPWAWELVKDGKLRGYSIGGRAQRLLADLPDENVGKAQESFEGAVQVEAEDTDPPATDNASLEEWIAGALAEAVKSINPVVNVVMPEQKTKVRRIERDEHGNIARIIEEE